MTMAMVRDITGGDITHDKEVSYTIPYQIIARRSMRVCYYGVVCVLFMRGLACVQTARQADRI